MSRCYNCKNNRRQVLRVNCKHDVCIRCAADNYFLNCKNKLEGKGSAQSNYFCESCLEQTPLDARTLQQLKNYFMDNILIEDKHKQNRREKLQLKEQQQKIRIQRLQRLDLEPSSRPKSLEIQIDQRRRTLSKYLNDKQVERFIEMQKEYGVSRRDKHHPKPPAHTHQTNEYELKTTKQFEALKKRDNANALKQKCSEIESFDQEVLKGEFARIKDYQNRVLASQRQDHQLKTKRHHQEYELYHNGKAVPHYNPTTANRILQQGKIADNGKVSENNSKSRYSSSSSARAIGKIKTKTPNIHTEPSEPTISPVLGKEQRLYLQKLNGEHRNQRLMSAKSEQNLEQVNSYQAYQTKAISIQYHQKNNSSCAEWELESRSTRKPHQEKTMALAERNSETMEQILETLEVSEGKREGRSKERSLQSERKEREEESEDQKIETYYCKIHEDEEIIYFCLKCNQLICSECALHGTHKQHEIHSLKKSAQLLRQNLVHNMSTLNKMLIQEQTKEKLLKECINELTLECTKQKEQIKSSFQNFIFAVDKKYKDLLREIEDRFSASLIEYTEKLSESRNTYIQVSQIKDSVSDTLQQCGFEEGVAASETSIAPAYNQLGNFHLKKLKHKNSHNQVGIEDINKLINTITSLSQFLKNARQAYHSPKKGSIISEPSSLKLSDSSNLLEPVEFDFFTTPTTNTPQRSANETPNRRSKRIVMGGYGLSVKNRIKLCRCQSIVQSLLEMQEIVGAIKLDAIEYQVRALS